MNNAQYEEERTAIFRALNDACRPLSEPSARKALAMALLAELLDEPRIDAEPILECIARAEATLYLSRFPPASGGAA